MKLAIFGSCVSRDAVKFLPPGIELVSYVARSSIVSAVHGVPYRVTNEIPESFGAFEGRMVRHDLEKTGLGDIVERKPDVILIDLIDERFQVYEFAGTLVTLSARIAKEEFGVEVRKKGKAIARDDDFSRCAAVMLDRISSGKPKIVVNEAYWAEEYVSDGERSTHDKVAWIRRNNDNLRRYYGAFRDLLPAESFIRHDRPLADHGHVWGPSPFHYTPDYYQHLAGKIAQLSGPVRRPSPAIHQ